MRRYHIFGNALTAILAFGLATSLLMAADSPASSPAFLGLGDKLMNGFSMVLLRIKPVADELELTDEQKAEVEKIKDESQKRWNAARDSLINVSREEAIEKHHDEEKTAAKELDAVLNEKQRARLRELKLQVIGPPALTAKEITDPLKLSASQRNMLDAFQAEGAKAGAAIIMAPGATDAVKAARVVRDTNEKMLSVLTPEQNVAFEKMKGKTLDSLTGRYGILSRVSSKSGAGAPPAGKPHPEDPK